MPVEISRRLPSRPCAKHLAAADGDSGRLPPERELASRIKVGRRTVREALDARSSWRARSGAGKARALSSASRTRRRSRGGGARAPGQPARDPRGAAVDRAGAGPARGDARLARRHRGDGARSPRRPAPPGMPRDYEQADAGFHRKIAECAGNAMFRAMFEMIIRVREKADWTRVRQYHFRHDHGAPPLLRRSTR